MSEAYFCCDEGQYLANKAFFEREHGPQDDCTMSVVIKGMKMPKIEGNKAIKAEIRQIDGKLEFGIMTGGYYCSQQWTYFPITEVPRHGRLIDTKPLLKKIIETWGIDADASDCNILFNLVADQPTIIEGDS